MSDSEDEVLLLAAVILHAEHGRHQVQDCMHPAHAETGMEESASTSLSKSIEQYLMDKKPKTHQEHLALTLATLCAVIEEKKPGGSKEICLEMTKLIQKATEVLSDI